jgi:3-oxoacyl-[acyl-carrier protein] reductase
MVRTALVTGASGGIGSAIAREMGRDHDVLVHYHSDAESAETVVEAIRDGGNEAIAHKCDVADPEAVASMADRAREELGPVDVLVNNAAIIYRTDLVKGTHEQMRRTLSVNLEGQLNCARAVVPGMCERGEGWVVCISSTAGTRGSPSDPSYGASKGGVIGFAKSLSRQHSGDGVFSNVVAPGPTDTEMFPQERRPAAREDLPTGRLIRPAEIAEAVRFFATTTSVSGKVLEVDAGKNP